MPWLKNALVVDKSSFIEIISSKAFSNQPVTTSLTQFFPQEGDQPSMARPASFPIAPRREVMTDTKTSQYGDVPPSCSFAVQENTISWTKSL
jgi:hypothetical protein